MKLRWATICKDFVETDGGAVNLIGVELDNFDVYDETRPS